MEILEACLPSRDNSEKHILRLFTKHPQAGRKVFTDHRHLELALKCGLKNTANFNRAFKKHTGMTPSEYKSSHVFLY